MRTRPDNKTNKSILSVGELNNRRSLISGAIHLVNHQLDEDNLTWLMSDGHSNDHHKEEMTGITPMEGIQHENKRKSEMAALDEKLDGGTDNVKKQCPQQPQNPINTQSSLNNTELNASGTGSGTQPQNVKNSFNYSKGHKGPYKVHIESTDGNNVHRFHPMAIAKKLKSIGHFPFKESRGSGYNRITVEFETAQEANSLANNSYLKNFNLKAYIPAFNVVCQGVIKGVDPELTDEEIRDMIEVPQGFGLVHIRRMQKRDKGNTIKKLESVVLSFNGDKLPEYVKILQMRCPVTKYIPQVIQCRNCLQFGHFFKNCRRKPCCVNCGEEHESRQCNKPEDSKCALCQGAHKGNDVKCIKYKQEKNIKRIMATGNVSYTEARDIYNGKRTFSQNKYAPLVGLGEDNFPKLAEPQRQKNKSAIRIDNKVDTEESDSEDSRGNVWHTRRTERRRTPTSSRKQESPGRELFYEYKESRGLAERVLNNDLKNGKQQLPRDIGWPNWADWIGKVLNLALTHITRTEGFTRKIITNPVETIKDLIVYCLAGLAGPSQDSHNHHGD